MLIINADDWGRSRAETEVAFACYARGRVNAVSAMVYMADSERAARVAVDEGMDVGLHVNFSQSFDQPGIPADLVSDQSRVVAFLRRSRYAAVVYNPWLRSRFIQVFHSQWEEFVRLYGSPPSHVDGHRHCHLCANVLIDGFVPAGVQMRRSFTYSKGERGPVNRLYRMLIDRALARRYRLTDSFFSLGEALRHDRLGKVRERARTGTVELMTHPVVERERDFLLSDAFDELVRDIGATSFASLGRSHAAGKTRPSGQTSPSTP